MNQLSRPVCDDAGAKPSANAARDYIFNQGVRGPRIQTEGRGAREPVASNESAWGRAKNRRIDIFVAQAQ